MSSLPGQIGSYVAPDAAGQQNFDQDTTDQTVVRPTNGGSPYQWPNKIEGSNMIPCVFLVMKPPNSITLK